jgi:uncharacterized membrane protein
MRHALVLLLLCCLSHPAIAADKPDKAYASTFKIAGKQIPLPAGEWRVVTQIDQPAAADRPSAGYVRQVVLVQLKKQVPIAVIVATANTEPSATGWGTSRDCIRTDILGTALLYESGIDVSCNFINHVVRVGADPASPLDSKIAQLAKAEGWSMPPTWLMAGFRIADRRDLLDVRYHFNPELVLPGRPAASWGGSPWSQAAVASSRNRAAAVASLSGWVGAAQQAIDDGFRHRLGADASLPFPWNEGEMAQPTPSGSGNGLRHPASADWQTSLEKTISWRIVGTMSDIAGAYAFTGNIAISGALAFVSAISSSVLYFGHEMVWDMLDPSGRKQPVILEVPQIGVTS